MFLFFVCDADDGISHERVAQVMGQLDHCHHAVHIINELVQTAQVCLPSKSGGWLKKAGSKSSSILSFCV